MPAPPSRQLGNDAAVYRNINAVINNSIGPASLNGQVFKDQITKLLLPELHYRSSEKEALFAPG